jgi:UDP-N-acetylmuramate dehydrogenase
MSEIGERMREGTDPQTLGARLRREEPLAPYTTVKVGGPAEYFATVTTVPQLLELVRWAQATHLPYFVLGGGSNMLVSDAGIRGLVIHNRCRQVRLNVPCRTAAVGDRGRCVSADSGAALAGLARQSIRAGLAGLEWAVSVPGTIGGAVVGNAGAHGGEVKDNLDYALILDAQGDLQEMGVDDLDYDYRNSRLKRMRPLRSGFNPVVLHAVFRLEQDDPAAIRSRAESYLAHRRRTQPVEPSLGSTFVNPPGDFAGRLIEAAGLKGARVGGAQVSALHANFIVNPGGVGTASAADIMQLIELVQAAVLSRFGIRLEPEVQLVGEW